MAPLVYLQMITEANANLTPEVQLYISSSSNDDDAGPLNNVAVAKLYSETLMSHFPNAPS